MRAATPLPALLLVAMTQAVAADTDPPWWSAADCQATMKKVDHRYQIVVHNGESCCLVRYRDTKGKVHVAEVSGSQLDDYFNQGLHLDPAKIGWVPERILDATRCDTVWNHGAGQGQASAQAEGEQAPSAAGRRARGGGIDLGGLEADTLSGGRRGGIDLGGLEADTPSSGGRTGGGIDLAGLDDTGLADADLDVRQVERELREWKRQQEEEKRRRAEQARLEEIRRQAEAKRLAEERRRQEAALARARAEQRRRQQQAELARMQAELEAQQLRQQQQADSGLGLFGAVVEGLARGYMAGTAIKHGYDPTPFLGSTAPAIPTMPSRMPSGPSGECLAASQRLANQMAAQANFGGNICAQYKQLRNFYQQSLSLHERCPSLDPSGQQRQEFRRQLRNIDRSIDQSCNTPGFGSTLPVYGGQPLRGTTGGTRRSTTGYGYSCPAGQTCATR